MTKSVLIFSQVDFFFFFFFVLFLIFVEWEIIIRKIVKYRVCSNKSYI